MLTGRRELARALMVLQVAAIIVVGATTVAASTSSPSWLASNLSRYGALTANTLLERMQESFEPGTRQYGFGTVLSDLPRFLHAALPQEWWHEYSGVMGVLLGLPSRPDPDQRATRAAAAPPAAHAGRRSPRLPVVVGIYHARRRRLDRRVAVVVSPTLSQPNDPDLCPVRRMVLAARGVWPNVTI